MLRRVAAAAALVLAAGALPAVALAGAEASAPVAGRSGVRQTFRVPTPTGGFERFAVQRTQTMESKLAAANPTS